MEPSEEHIVKVASRFVSSSSAERSANRVVGEWGNHGLRYTSGTAGIVLRVEKPCNDSLGPTVEFPLRNDDSWWQTQGHQSPCRRFGNSGKAAAAASASVG